LPNHVSRTKVDFFPGFYKNTLKNCEIEQSNRYEYLWADGQSVTTPLKVTAAEYIDYLMSWVENQLSNEILFPYKPGKILNPWSNTSESLFLGL
jgi:hypothetical protein